MTSAETALAFAFLGGVVVALGLGSLTYWLAQQLGAFRERSADAARERAYATARIEEAISMAARATDGTRILRAMLESDRRRADAATDARVLTDRHARIVRLRRARARGERIS